MGVDGRWSDFDQHCIYILLGHLCLTRLAVGKNSLIKERYRDWMAGSNQHFANGLLYASLDAFKASSCESLTVPGTDLWFESPLEMARDAMKYQQQAVALRSEKYAANHALRNGKSSSAFPAYKAALELLAKCLAAVAAMTQDEKERQACERFKVTYETRAANLALDNPVILDNACSAMLTEEQMKQVAGDIAVRNLAPIVLGIPVKPVEASDLCLECGKNPPTHAGVTCRCRCLCKSCVIEDALMDCPSCGQFSEFRP